MALGIIDLQTNEGGPCDSCYQIVIWRWSFWCLHVLYGVWSWGDLAVILFSYLSNYSCLAHGIRKGMEKMQRAFEIYPYCAMALNYLANHFFFTGQHFLVEQLTETALAVCDHGLMKSHSYYNLARCYHSKVNKRTSWTVVAFFLFFSFGLNLIILSFSELQM